MTSPVRALRPAAGHLDTARGCRTAPLPRLAYSEPVRRDRCRRTRAGRLRGHVRPPTRNLCEIDTETGEILPVVTIVTDNGGPFRSFRLEAFILKHPELSHVRTRVKSPGQNGSRERGLGTLKYERLYLDEMDDAVMLAKARRGMPDRVQRDQAPRSPVLEPAQGGAPRPGQPDRPDISNHRKPANSPLTRDIRKKLPGGMRQWSESPAEAPDRIDPGLALV